MKKVPEIIDAEVVEEVKTAMEFEPQRQPVAEQPKQVALCDVDTIALKAIGFEQIAAIEQAQAALNAIRGELARRSQPQ